MEDYERSRIEALLDRDPELSELWNEHLELDKRIEKLESQMHLSPSESLSCKQLQKQKLAGKDKIAQILARYPDD
ncbi:MAG: YdcH family protein [Deltaproteobacteria bacterium]|nr:YdcH family protein [Deltaproteobacteria bacterium]MBW2415873.1 YdcH family protein [Deltaproteobacteria bacterium]